MYGIHNIRKGLSIMKSRYISFFLLLVWMSLIFLLSTQNGEQTVAISSGIADWIADNLYKEPTPLQINDMHMLLRKIAHIILFSGFGFLSFYSFLIVFTSRLGLVALGASTLTVIVAFFDEWHKAFIPGRHCHIEEALLNAVSGCIAIACCIFWHLFRKKRKKI